MRCHRVGPEPGGHIGTGQRGELPDVPDSHAPQQIRQVFADATGVPLAETTSSIPLGRPGDPRDIAEMVAFLVSDRAQWITGSSFVVDGGDHPAVFG